MKKIILFSMLLLLIASCAPRNIPVDDPTAERQHFLLDQKEVLSDAQFTRVAVLQSVKRMSDGGAISADTVEKFRKLGKVVEEGQLLAATALEVYLLATTPAEEAEAAENLKRLVDTVEKQLWDMKYLWGGYKKLDTELPTNDPGSAFMFQDTTTKLAGVWRS